MKCDKELTAALSDFCTLMLCGDNEGAFTRCREYMEEAEDEYGGVPEILYLMSGMAADPDDPWGNVADEEKQFVKPQHYLISTDAGAPELDDFFWFVENVKKARSLDLALDKERFSAGGSITDWLPELAAQLNGLYVVNFDGGGDDYHFTIMDQEDCAEARRLFEKITAHIEGYSYTSFIITENFCG